MNGQRTYSVTELARLGEKDSMRTIVISAEWRGKHGKAVALYFGDIMPDTRPGAAPGAKRESWRFLPASQVKSVGENQFQIPAWLAEKERLMEYEIGGDDV